MPRPVAVEQSRVILVDVSHAFDVTLPIPLTEVFSRRYALLPPIIEVRGQNAPWGEVGQTRTVATADGGTMCEVLTEIDRPRSFSYQLREITGPMRPLVDHVDGRWEFTATDSGGTRVTWRWTLHPKGAGILAVPLVAAMWRRYAARALEQLARRLLASEPTAG